MHKKQIKYLYSSLLFVLAAAYCFSSAIEDGSIAFTSSQSIHYTDKINCIQVQFIGHGSSRNQPACPKDENGIPKHNGYPYTTYHGMNPGERVPGNVLPGIIEQKNYLTIKRNKKSISRPANDEQTG